MNRRKGQSGRYCHSRGQDFYFSSEVVGHRNELSVIVFVAWAPQKDAINQSRCYSYEITQE